MKAELIAVGNELLVGQTVDTNSAWLGAQLTGLGIEVLWKTTVGDDRRRIAAALRQALKRADLVVLTGGLGPTADDVTVEAVAAALRLPLERSKSVERKITRLLSDRGIPVLPSHLKQALLPRGARELRNPVGTAPGLLARAGRALVATLPGVPVEMRQMAERSLFPLLRGKARGAAIRWRVLKFVGTGETVIEERIGALARSANPRVAFLPGQGELLLRVTARAPARQAAERLLDKAQDTILQKAGEFYVGSEQETLEKIVGDLLRARGLTLAVAESCTGGLIGHMITNVPGSSGYFLMGVVAYSNDAKVKMLGVPRALIEKHGAVSEEVARAMASGVRKRAAADVAIAVTGIAGPTGGTREKPVGLVFTAACGKGWSVVKRHLMGGDREVIKRRSAIAALALLRTELLARARTRAGQNKGQAKGRGE